jgi:hypothetical protein
MAYLFSNRDLCTKGFYSFSIIRGIFNQFSQFSLLGVCAFYI